MFWIWKKNKTIVRELPEFLYSVKKYTTFAGEETYYPLVKEDQLLSSWNIMYRVNGRQIMLSPINMMDEAYACTSMEECDKIISDYKKQIFNLYRNDTHIDELILKEKNKSNEYENEK